jgi:hypothetical protein
MTFLNSHWQADRVRATNLLKLPVFFVISSHAKQPGLMEYKI